jgi:thymidine kinase
VRKRCKCQTCQKWLKTVKRHRLFHNEDDACIGVNGFYLSLCRKCTKQLIYTP